MVATPSYEHLLSARPVWVTGQAWAIPVGLWSGRSAHHRGPCVSRAVLSHLDGWLGGGGGPAVLVPSPLGEGLGLGGHARVHPCHQLHGFCEDCWQH